MIVTFLSRECAGLQQAGPQYMLDRRPQPPGLRQAINGWVKITLLSPGP
jgi:hypothetical protein